MDGFSGTIKISNISDFIAPSQDCIVTTQQENKSKIKQNNGLKSQNKAKEEAIKVTLADCLACSGCITTAETILLEQQSFNEVIEKIKDPNTIVVFSISPQSRASIAAHFELTPIELIQKLTIFLRRLKIDYIFDLTIGYDIALNYAANEFINRYKTGNTPVITSECPGWICYAEKTHGDYILPYLSKTKSAQAIMGTLIKQYFFKNKDLIDIYHCTIAPCFDKKLEASRDDFYIPNTKIPEVDCSLTSSELIDLIKSKNDEFELSLPNTSENENLCYLDKLDGTRDLIENKLFQAMESATGAYLEFIIRYASKLLFNQNTTEKNIQKRTLRNSDFKVIYKSDFTIQNEYDLILDNEIKLRFASIYGFRNIQTLVRKIKNGNCHYDYIELMACPLGCINGGGQGKAPNEMSHQQWIQKMNSMFFHNDFRNMTDEDYYDKIISNLKYNEKFDTEYHKREKLVTIQNLSDW